MSQTRPVATDLLPVVRELLARLYQALLAAERQELEAERGLVEPAEYLQLLVEDQRFEWLRPMGWMVTKLDQFLVMSEKRGTPIPERITLGLLNEVRRVVSRSTGLHAGWRYADWVQRDPEIVLAHSALASALRPQPNAWAA